MDIVLVWVRDRLRLHDMASSDGLPPAWALEAVHNDVTARERARWTKEHKPHPLTTAVHDDVIKGLGPAITLKMTPRSVQLEARGIGHSDIQDPGFNQQLGRPQHIAPVDEMGFDAEHWRRLEQAACDKIRIGIAALRVDFEASYPRRRPAGLAHQNADVDLLVRWLVHRRQPTGEERRRVRDLYRRLGLRPPDPIRPERPPGKRRRVDG